MFKEERSEPSFHWGMLGDLDSGRPNLGRATDVAVYRLMQFTLRDVLIAEHGVQEANRIFLKAGEVAGRHFCRNMIQARGDLAAFVAELQKVLKDLGVGVLRIESADPATLEFTIAVGEDLDCSGLPPTDEVICTYDEGFLAGVLEEYAGRPFTARETDCWCTGDRTCRFAVKPR